MLRLVVQVFDSWQCHFVALGTITPCLLRPLFPCQGFTHGLPTKGMPRIEQTARCLSRIQQSKRYSSNHATNGCFALPHRSTQAPVRQISVVAKSRVIVPGQYAWFSARKVIMMAVERAGTIADRLLAVDGVVEDPTK